MFYVLGEGLPFWVSVDQQVRFSMIDRGPKQIDKVTPDIQYAIDRGDIIPVETYEDGQNLCSEITAAIAKKQKEREDKNYKVIVSNGEFRPSNPFKSMKKDKEFANGLVAHSRGILGMTFSAGVMSQEEIDAEVKRREEHDKKLFENLAKKEQDRKIREMPFHKRLWYKVWH